MYREPESQSSEGTTVLQIFTNFKCSKLVKKYSRVVDIISSVYYKKACLVLNGI